MCRRLTSILLLLCLLLAALPVRALAAAPETQLSYTGRQLLLAAGYSDSQLAQAEDAASALYSGQAGLVQSRFDALTALALLAGTDALQARQSELDTLLQGGVTGNDAANLIASFVPVLDESSAEFAAWIAKLMLYGDYDGTSREYCQVFDVVRLDANGGSLDTAILLAAELAPYGQLPQPEHPELPFAGWYTQPEGGEPVTADTLVTGSTTLYAHWGWESAAPRKASTESMSASQDLIEFIKACEGFSKYAVWDYQQWSIGYGSYCEPGEYPDGITEEEAETLLRKYVDQVAAAVNAFAASNGLSMSQGQFDALVTFSYGVGTAWMSSGSTYDIKRYVVEGCTELEFVNCLGSWVVAGGQTLEGLVYRRMRESNIYWHGDYSMTGSIAADVPYSCLLLDSNGGTVSNSRMYTYRGRPYGLYATLPTPVREGYYFAGWTDAGGNRIDSSSLAKAACITVTAKWSQSASDAYHDPGVNGTLGFSDVSPSDWFYPYVEQAVADGLFNGVSASRFAPETTMTRAMFVQVLYRLYGAPRMAAPMPFADVRSGVWYYDAVLWARETGVVTGVSETQFAPNDTITRQQMATMLYKYSALCGNVDSATAKPLDGFPDNAQVSNYARAAMQWAIGNGIINGVSQNGQTYLRPRDGATRAQAATMLVRYSKAFSGKSGVA